MDRTTKGIAAIIVCATLWSIGGLFIKLVAWHPMVIAGGRSLVAALFMLTARRFSVRSAAAAHAKLPTTNHYALWGAALANAATMLLFVTANKLTSSANAILLQYAAPVYAALLGWILVKEKPRAEHWLALIAVSFGLVLFFKDGLSTVSFLGDSIAVISGITFGSYSVFMRLQKDGRPEDSILISHLVTAAVGLPFALVYPPTFSVPAIAAILTLGILQIGIASLFFAYGIRRVTAVQAMLAAVIEPVLNPVWVLIVMGEKPSAAAIAGGAVILAAVTVSSVIGVRRTRAR
jgi:drug/metabolite transporter (DMT)-like permease